MIISTKKGAPKEELEKIVDRFEKQGLDVTLITGKDYKFFNYYGHPEADRLIVVMGSGASVVEETIGELMRRGEKVGMVNVRLYRP